VVQKKPSILGDKKKVLVSVSDLGEKRTFVVAFGNGLRKNDDSLKTIAKEIHWVEKRTLEKLIKTTTDPEKKTIYTQELNGINQALNNPNISKFGGPASLMRTTADDVKVKDLVFNFSGVRSSADDIIEAVVRGRVHHQQEVLAQKNSKLREQLFRESKE
jgi:hypothetical protein